MVLIPKNPLAKTTESGLHIGMFFYTSGSGVQIWGAKAWKLCSYLLSGVGIILTLIGNFIIEIRFSISSPYSHNMYNI